MTRSCGNGFSARGSKRPKTPNQVEEIRRQRKKYGGGKIQDILSATADNDISCEEDEASLQMHVYDNLLRVLGSCNDDETGGLYCGRQKHQVSVGDPDGSDDGGFDSASTFEEEVDGGSNCKVNFKDDDDDDKKESLSTMEGRVEESEDDEEASDNDVLDFERNTNVLAGESKTISSFQHHFGHVLTNEEVDNLMKWKIRFKWEMPAHELSISKIVGTGQNLSTDLTGEHFQGINQKLYDHWQSICNSTSSDASHSSKRRLFFSLCNVYRDIMHCNKKPFYLKDQDEDSSIMDAYIMHALNHMYKTRDLVIKNDAKLKNHGNNQTEEILFGGSYLDQGFTRPKVLILLPLASIAFRVIKRLVQLTPLSHKGNVAHMDRFSEEFGSENAEEDDENIDGSSKSRKTAKPADFQILFGGNNNDHFMIGIKFTKRSIKLYSSFYSSDIIIASPLGLITKIGEAEIDKEKDVDYLSSIELLIIDHADVITMQNWSHLNTVVELLNRMPSKQHETDVMRIKKWYLEGRARFYRQTILLGYSFTPDMNALFNHLCLNYEGKVKLLSKYKGVLHQVLLQVRQVYEQFEPSSIVDADNIRLEHFCKKIFPKIKDALEGGTMLFISSYFEFVRIRNFLKSENASFCLLGEYTKQSDISRARLWFFEGKRKIMLYTERAHFYHRYKIRGIKNLIIYSLPERKEFYPEIVNMLEGSLSCSVLFSRFDHYRLERIVGSTAAKRMISSDKSIFVFC